MPKVGQKTATILPTVRMAAQKQQEVLRAYAASCGNEPRSVTNAEVAAIVKLKQETVSLANGFFASVELLTKSENGYIPSEEILNYGRAFQWNPETAFQKVAPKLEKTWFADSIIPKLRFKPLSMEEALSAIGDAAAVGPDAKPQLELILFFLEQSGIVERENGTIKLGKGDSEIGQKKNENPFVPPKTDILPEKEKPRSQGGGIDLNFSISVNMQEMGKWKPERITAFMGGLAQVLAAKGETITEE